MHKHKAILAFLALVALIGLTTVPMSGCDSLPGDRGTQGAVIGGAGGAVLGAVIAKENRLIGALIGGLLGAGGGYLIGAKTDWFEDDDEDVRREAEQSVEKARDDPATPAEALKAKTADINNDGFVTLDEVVAMENAGLTDTQMIRRLEDTGQIFDLNSDQKRVLLDAGVSRKVIDRMETINQDDRERLLTKADPDDDVISRDKDIDRD